MSAAGLLLDAICGQGAASGFVEARMRTVGTARWGRTFVPVGDRERLRRVLRDMARRSDVYLGCTPRVRHAGTNGAVATGWILWTDCDTAEAVDALDAFPLAPALTIASGTPGHVHAYWPLDRPVAARDLAHANRRLAATLGSDPAVTNANAIMRAPETLTHKTRPPTAVRPLTVTAGRTDLDALLACCDELPVLTDAPLPRRLRDRPDGLLDVAPEDYVRRLLGVEMPASRKVSCPAHEDRTPSLHVYAGPADGWFCFGCQRGGTIFDLAALVFDMPTRGPEFLQLRRRLESLWGIAT